MRSEPTESLPRVALTLAAVFHLLPPIIFLIWLRPGSMGEGGDFPTYYFALREALRGGNPYDVQNLQALTDWSVAPYLYPPPFLLTMLWSLPLSPQAGVIGMFVLNELLLVAILWLMRKHLGLPWKGVVLLLATFFPSWDNLAWGQVNLLLLLPVLGAILLAPRRPLAAGALVGAAALMKVLPGLLLLYWVVRREWRPVAAAVASAAVLTVLSLPLMGPGMQLAYYGGTLLNISSGNLEQLGLAVPVVSEYNHSVLGVLSHLWPGPNDFEPSRMAMGVTVALVLVLLALWAWRVHQGGSPQAALASLFGIASIASTYAWEHYLLLLLPALVLAARDGAPRRPLTVLYICTVFPLGLLLVVFSLLPGILPSPLLITPWITAAKLVGVVGISALCLRAEAPAATPAADPHPAPGAV